MQAKNILIISFGNPGDREIKAVREGLKAKYANRSTVQYLAAVRVEPTDDDRGKVFDTQQWKKPVTTPTGSERDFGLYLVFHYMAGQAGSFYRGTNIKEEGEYLARWVCNLAFKEHKFAAVGKVCCLACEAATAHSGGVLLDHFCAAMAAACKGAKWSPPLVAGWDDVVTVLAKNNKSANPTLVTEANIGRKQVGFTKQGALARDHRDKKFVWRYKEGKYERVLLSGSGWSDKTAALPTQDNKVATIHTED